MRIFIATDIHGSAHAAQRIVEQFNKQNADLLVLLGDIYNHGPRNPFPEQYAPMQVAEILNGIADKLIVIKGNCDSEVDQMISNFTFLQNNMLLALGRKLFFTHGHIFNTDNLPCLSTGDVMFFGHFHINKFTDVNGVTCVNVGSCALPKDGVPSYCVADEDGISLVSLDDGSVIAQHKF